MNKQLFHELCPNEPSLKGRESKDFHLDELFEALDKTKSAIGSQYLFHILRNPSLDYNQITSREKIIQWLDENEKEKKTISQRLERFNKSIHYLLPNVIFDTHEFDIKLLKLSYFTVPIMLACIPLFYFSWGFILFSSVLALFNSTLFFVNKIRIQFFIDIIYSYYDFQSLIWDLAKIETTELKVVKSHKSSFLCNFIGKSLLQTNLSKNFFLGEMAVVANIFVEILSSVVCLDFFIVELFLTHLSKTKENLLECFKEIGEFDVALCVSVLRSTQETCVPKMSSHISINGMTHPLIQGCISNSIHIEQRNVFINGANMSGKSSFLRMLAVNQLLFQTINTCFAKTYASPVCNIYSIISINDDITKGISFFKREVDLFKKLLVDTACVDHNNLIVVDEPLKGTNPDYSNSISYALLAALSSNRKNNIIMTTHSFKLSDLLKKNLSFEQYCFNETIVGAELKYDYKLKRGPLVSYNPIGLLRANSFPSSIIDEAELTYLALTENKLNEIV